MNISLTKIILVSVFATLAVKGSLYAQAPVGSQAQNREPRRYKLVDVGTLGGPASYYSGDFIGGRTLNNLGTATGYADTSTPDPHSPNCFDADCFTAHAFRWKYGVLTDLGALPGTNSSLAAEINSRGWVVGASQINLIDPLTGYPESRATIWKDGRIINLGTLGGTVSFAVGLNNRGEVVGHSSNTISDPFSLDGFPTQTRGFIWENGMIKDMGTLGGADSAPFGHPNERGQISGNSYINLTPNLDTGIPTLDPFLWDQGAMTDLGTLGGTVGFGQGLNNRGQVIGQSNLAGNLTFHPFLWDMGVLTDLGTLGGDNGTTSWINDSGQIVGEADLPGSQTHDAFLWAKGVMSDLGNLGQTSYAFAINSGGQVVGHSLANDGTYHAFLWERGEPMIDLNSFVTSGSSLAQLTDALNINDLGEIYGVGVPPGVLPQDVDSGGHVFLLIPCADGENGCQSAIAVHNANPAPTHLAATERLNSAARFAKRFHLSAHRTEQP